ncbi:MAG: ABC transporter substrate-binding protein [Rhodobacteraceae bacterium]|nr:ABC transporter substrate-binding protein [Paracoccaceae bacterium]
MSDIVLTSAVRENLLSLKSTAQLQSKTQNRLATGLKVNSALDNPNSYFTAATLNARASDLTNLLDNMGQAIQTIRAADDGISSMTKLVESAKAIANQALQTQSVYQRKTYAQQYNAILNQIEDLARDAGYKGKNLLAGDGNDLKVIFNEDSTSNLKVQPVDYTDTSLSTGLSLTDLATGAGATSSFNLNSGVQTLDLPNLQASSNLTDMAGWYDGDIVTIDDGVSAPQTFTVGTDITTVQDYINAINDLPGVKATFDEGDDAITVVSGLPAGQAMTISKDTSSGNGSAVATDGGLTAGTTTITPSALTASTTLISSGGFEIEDIIYITDSNGYEAASLEIDENTTVDDLVSLLKTVKGLDATFAAGQVSLIGDISWEITSTNRDFNIDDFTQSKQSVSLTATPSDFAQDTDIERTLQAINNALDVLRSDASDFGTSLSTVQIRTDFTEELINTLEVGAGALTIADMNEEGANMLALQTRQQLSSTALSLASQAEQSVLSLFG